MCRASTCAGAERCAMRPTSATGRLDELASRRARNGLSSYNAPHLTHAVSAMKITLTRPLRVQHVFICGRLVVYWIFRL